MYDLASNPNDPIIANALYPMTIHSISHTLLLDIKTQYAYSCEKLSYKQTSKQIFRRPFCKSFKSIKTGLVVFNALTQKLIY